MKERTKLLIVKALKREKIDFSDNLHRAKRAADKYGRDSVWGQTGRTIGQLLDEYQTGVDEIEAAIRETEAL